MFSSSLVQCVLLSAVAVVATALNSLEYSGAHRSSPLAPHPGLSHPGLSHPGLPHHMQYAAFDGVSSSLPGTHGNMYPEHGYAYSGPVSSASFTRRVHGYQGYPGAHHPGAGAIAPQMSQMGHHPYGAALGYNYAPSYAPGFMPESGHYMPSYGAHAPTYTPGAMSAYRPTYQDANLYAPGTAYAPAYPAAYAPQTNYAPSQQVIHPSESSGLPTIIANKKRSLPALPDNSQPQVSQDGQQKSEPQK